jgi:hypothetical protein
MKKVGEYFGFPLAFWVIALLSAGLALGLFFPKDPLIQFLYLISKIESLFPVSALDSSRFFIGDSDFSFFPKMTQNLRGTPVK